MQIYSGTGVATTGEIRITKSFHMLQFVTTQNPQLMSALTIHLYLERTNGKNIDVCKSGTVLRDFITHATFGVNAITDFQNLFRSNCPISQGNFPLTKDDVFKLQISGLDPAETYTINTIEVPEESNTLVSMDTTIFPSDELERDFDVIDNDLLLLRGDSTVFDELQSAEVHFTNGKVIRYTPQELLAIQLDSDWCAVFGDTNAPVMSVNELVLGLRGIMKITLRKLAGNPMSLVFMDFNSGVV